MLKYRLIFGPLLIAGAIALFWLDRWLDRVPIDGETLPPGIILAALLLVLIPLATRELAAVLRLKQFPVYPWIINVGAIATAVSLWIMPAHVPAPTGAAIIATVIIASLVATLLWHVHRARIPGALAAAGATLLPLVYLGLMGGFFLAMRLEHSAWVVLAVILITKSGDIGAYFTGRAIGKHKLIEWLSPKKTWEGLAGGIVLATLVAVGFAWLSHVTDLTSVREDVGGVAVEVPRRYHLGWSALAGAIIAVIGHAGDLTMSLFKRDAGLKDSGNLLPGFGGLMDVLDSPLLVAPVAYWCLQLAAV